MGGRRTVARLRRNTQSAIVVDPLRPYAYTAPPYMAALSSKAQPTMRVAPAPFSTWIAPPTCAASTRQQRR